MIFKDYYKILGLETNKVNQTQIKNAYKEQAKKYHPDVNGGNSKYEERFKDINEAYNILSNLTSKRKYDRTWNSHVGKYQRHNVYQAQTSKEVVWNMFFGNSLKKENEPKIRKEGKRGENIETEINISLEEAFNGNEKTIGLRTVDGKMKTFKINVPAGIQNNEKIRLIGQGKRGTGGAKDGDLFIKVKIEDNKTFELDGYNLRSDLYLTPWEAALSTKVQVPTIDGDVSIYVPAGIQSGEEIVIENKGYKNGKGGRGDLILETKIMIPKTMSNQEEELFKELKEKSKFNPRGEILS